ncbi:hypothetical protein AB6A40_001286 [Gnathostoma spinigerum]|uniref:Uncharacterized protein n=1 Tax=Gnathostoma spinigerum TaxID=75299 RepID=A0ABD6E5Y2_9BILA
MQEKINVASSSRNEFQNSVKQGCHQINAVSIASLAYGFIVIGLLMRTPYIVGERNDSIPTKTENETNHSSPLPQYDNQSSSTISDPSSIPPCPTNHSELLVECNQTEHHNIQVGNKSTDFEPPEQIATKSTSSPTVTLTVKPHVSETHSTSKTTSDHSKPKTNLSETISTTSSKTDDLTSTKKRLEMSSTTLTTTKSSPGKPTTITTLYATSANAPTTRKSAERSKSKSIPVHSTTADIINELLAVANVTQTPLSDIARGKAIIILVSVFPRLAQKPNTP